MHLCTIFSRRRRLGAALFFRGAPPVSGRRRKQRSEEDLQAIKRVKRNTASVIVRRDLIQRIKGGFFKDGMLPSEEDIANLFGVSRITVRDALAGLENLGYISRIQGKGTMVNRTISSLTGRVSEGQPFMDLIRSQGFEPSVVNGKAEKLAILPKIKESLQTGSEEMYQVEKLFLGDGMPMVFSTNYFSTDYVTDEILEWPMDETLIFTLLQDRLGFPIIAYDIVSICPCAADAYISAQLQLPEGTPMLRFEAVSVDSMERPLMLNYEYYHPEKMHFREVRHVDYHMNI